MKEDNKYMVIVVQAYEDEEPRDALKNVTVIELMESSPKRAIQRAKKLISRKHYRVSRIIENFKR